MIDATTWSYLDILYAAGIALLVLLMGVGLARLMRTRVLQARPLVGRDPSTATLIANFVYVSTIVLFALIVLDLLGVNAAALATAVGVSGLAISLSLQDVLKNVVAGVYVLLERPFQIGDTISVRDTTGEVLGIELRTTRLRTETGAEVIAPNAVVLTELVTNRSPADVRVYSITVAGPRTALQNACDDIRRIIEQSPAVVSAPGPTVSIDSVTTDTVSLKARLWMKKDATEVAEIVERLEQRWPNAEVTAQAEG